MRAAEAASDRPLAQLLRGIVAEFEAKTNAFAECEVYDKMQLVVANRNLTKQEQDLYGDESDAFLFRRRHYNDPPGYFQPMASFPNANGTMTLLPDPARLTAEAVGRWKNHLQSSKNPILRARYADLLWSFQKAVEGVAPRISMARNAIDAYLEASHLNDAAVYLVTGWLGRAVDLSASVKDTPRLAKSVQRALEWTHDNGSPNAPETWTFLFEDIYSSARVDDENKLKVIAYLESVLAETTDQKAKSFDHQSATFAANMLAKHYRRTGNKSEEQRVLRTVGTAVEHAAAAAVPLFAVSWLEPLVQMYRDAGMTAEAERAQIECRRRGKDVGADMKAIPYTVQIPKEAVDQYLDWLLEPQDASMRVLRWAVSTVSNVDNAEKSLIESLRTTPLLARICIRAMNDGQVVAKAGSIEDDLDGRLAYYLRQALEIRFNLFVGSWQKVAEAGGVDLTTLSALFTDCPAFDEEGRDLVCTGIDRFLQEDHIAATHILIPQIERALRTTLGLLGRPTNTAVRGEKGVMQEKNMSEALGDPAMNVLLPENMRRHLQIVFSSRLGLNLRNCVAHGILPAREFSILTSLLSLQGLLLLSQIRIEDAPPNARR